MARPVASPLANGHIASEPSISSPLNGQPTIRNDWNKTKISSITSEIPDDESKVPPDDSTLYPSGTRSLSFIGAQAFGLGNVFSASLVLTAFSVYAGRSIWRLPAFFVFLSLFHFLEYYTTARFNTPGTRASSFLLFNNGRAYTLAHTLATIEILISNFFLPSYQTWLFGRSNIIFGLLLIGLGQSIRSGAMVQAGTNFNHIIAREHRASHILVTDGLYHYLRHPSYFGFFWWALGTQILVGNKICFLGYAVALWKFFYARIIGE